MIILKILTDLACWRPVPIPSPYARLPPSWAVGILSLELRVSFGILRIVSRTVSTSPFQRVMCQIILSLLKVMQPYTQSPWLRLFKPDQSSLLNKYTKVLGKGGQYHLADGIAGHSDTCSTWSGAFGGNFETWYKTRSTHGFGPQEEETKSWGPGDQRPGWPLHTGICCSQGPVRAMWTRTTVLLGLGTSDANIDP